MTNAQSALTVTRYLSVKLPSKRLYSYRNNINARAPSVSSVS